VAGGQELRYLAMRGAGQIYVGARSIAAADTQPQALDGAFARSSAPGATHSGIDMAW
jgi:hypothetical protein